MLKVTVLGSAGMFATTERAASGYLVDIAGKRLWLDAGAGTWRNLLTHIDYAEIDGVLLTHVHPDHVTDVFQAYHARLYGPRAEVPKVPLWAPQETLDAVCALAPKIDEAFAPQAVAAGGSIEVFGARLAFTEMAHPPETIGVRIEHGPDVVAYSSDTGAGADFSALAQDAGLFICEATFQDRDDQWEGHLSASSAAAIAARCSVRRLLLTHLPPERDVETSVAEARAAAPGLDLDAASDGQVIEVGR